MSKTVWKIVETNTSKIGMGKRRRKRKERRKERDKKRKKEKRLAEEWEIWDQEGAATLEAEAKGLVLERFHKWIYIFGKKTSERMSTKKLWNYTIEIKKEFVPRKGKVYPLLQEEREKICKFYREERW